MRTAILNRRVCRGVAASIVALMLGAAVNGVAAAQSPAGADSIDSKPDAKADPPEPAGPDTTIWVDDQGVPRPVVGLSYEELVRAWRLLEGVEQGVEEPAFVREEIDARGVVAEGRVDLDAEFVIALPSGGRVAVPLGFSGVVLTQPPAIRAEGDGADAASGPDQFVAYDPERGGFVAWLRGEAGDRRRVSLSVTCPLQRDNLQTLLRLNIPRATRSRLIVEASDRLKDPFVSSEALLEIGSDDTLGGATQLIVTGAVGDFQLGWRTATPVAATRQRAVLSVEGRVFSEVDGLSIRSKATLVVKPYGGVVERFRVRLPRGSTRIPAAPSAGDTPGLRVTTLPNTETESDTPVCLVTLARPTSDPLTLTLETEQPVGLGDDATLDLAGFDVVGAVRQYGDVALRVAEDWRLRWGDTRLAQRIDPSLLAEELQRPGLSAGLKYYGQPWKLETRIVRQGTRVEATPSYRLEIKPDKAVLTTKIDYRIPGARVSGFAVDLRDWARLSPTPPIGPAELVDTARVTQNADNELYVPLLRPTSQQARIEFTSEIELPRRDQTLSLRMPIAKATTQGVSELLVVVDPSIVLTPDPVASRRLRAEAVPQGSLDEDDPSGLRTFRFVGYLPDQLFVAEKRLRPGEIDVAVESRVFLRGDETSVDQSHSFESRYEPVTMVRFSAPAAAVATGELSFELLPGESDADGATDADDATDGVPLTYREAEGPADPAEQVEPEGSGRTEVIVDLPRPWIGRLQLRSRFRLPEGLRALSRAGGVSVPLLSPLDARLTSHRALVWGDDGRRLALGAKRGPWTQADESESLDRGVLLVDSDTPAEVLKVIPRPIAALQEGDVVLHRSWNQTWVAESATQQRTAFRFSTTASSVAFELPPDLPTSDPKAPAAKTEVLLDGRLVRDLAFEGRRVTVPLANSGPMVEQRTLEVRYLEPPIAATGTIAWRPPRFFASSANAVHYWQVVLPSGRVLLNTPRGFAAVMAWGVRQGVWGRRPTLDTAQLEAWADASRGGRPTGGEQAYLFSALGDLETHLQSGPAPASAASANRPLIVVTCSAAVLGLGLAFMSLPWLRRPQALLAFTVAAIGVGVAYPGPFMLAVQAGLLGLVLATLAAVLSAMLRQPLSTGTRLTGSSVPAASPRGTDTLIALPMAGVSTNAPTVSLPPADNQG